MSAIKKAAEMLRREAESMKECHTVGVGGEWYGDSAKADYDEMIATANAAIAERDELLEAIAGLVGCIDHGSENPTEKLDAARAAIAKAIG